MKYIKYLRNGKMDKNLKITIVIGIIIAIAVIGLALINESNNAKTQVSPLTDSFDYSSMPITTWDNNTKTYTFDQNISSVNGKDYKDITMSIIFYKDNVKGKFKLEKNFPKTTHLILMEQPKEVAESIKKFMLN